MNAKRKNGAYTKYETNKLPLSLKPKLKGIIMISKKLYKAYQLINQALEQAQEIKESGDAKDADVEIALRAAAAAFNKSILTSAHPELL